MPQGPGQDAIVDNPYRAYGTDDIIDQPGVFPQQRRPQARPQYGPPASAATYQPGREQYGPPAELAGPEQYGPPASLAPNASAGGQSPTELIHAYLTAKGLPLTSANISAALMQNAREPGTIAGLVNQAPPSTGAVPGGAGGGGAGGGAQTQPAPSTNPTQSADRDKDNTVVTTPPMQPSGTSTASTFNPSSSDIAAAVLLAAAPALAGGAYYATRNRGTAPDGSATTPAPAETTAAPETKAATTPETSAAPNEVVKASEEGAAKKGLSVGEPAPVLAPNRAEMLGSTALTPPNPPAVPTAPTATVDTSGRLRYNAPPVRKPPVVGSFSDLVRLGKAVR